MPETRQDPFQLTAAEIAALLQPGLALLPELEQYRANPAALAQRPWVRLELAHSAAYMPGIETIPQTRYTHYRYFIKNGDRTAYEGPYFDKRRNLGMLALRVFLGETQWKDLLQDYLWDICEETTWVLPAHERMDAIDLFAAETAFDLGVVLYLLGNTLDAEVRARVRHEVDARVFQFYLAHYGAEHWYMGGGNWNGVCNSSVAAAFLLLEPDGARVARALELALAGLNHFLSTAFEPDGTSTEGVGYWAYGLSNFVALSEMLRARSGGALDLLSDQRMRRIAGYPAKLLLSGSMFAAFSDSDEVTHFNPGIITRLAERTGEQSLYNLLAKPVDFEGEWQLKMMLPAALWWDGTQLPAPAIEDAVLHSGGVARLVVPLPGGGRAVAAIKAGHNNENHNQNDVGSFLVHAGGENLLTDPGRGLYSRFYFGPQRYENIFANSFGHSLPRIGGKLQLPGVKYRGELLETCLEDAHEKTAVVEFAQAYAVSQLTSLRRRLRLTDVGVLWLEDTFCFNEDPLEVEEAFVTWAEVSVSGPQALIHGQQHNLRLTVESPPGASFVLQALEGESRANDKPGILKRLTITMPPALKTCVQVRMEIQPLSME
jgi:hypothetical protein